MPELALLSWLAPLAGVRPGGRPTFLPRSKKVGKIRPTAHDPSLRCGQPALGTMRGVPQNSLCASRAAQTTAASQMTKQACPSAGLPPRIAPTQAWAEGEGRGRAIASLGLGFWGWVMSQLSNLSAPFIFRPIATMLMTIGLALAGAVSYFLLPVAPLPQVDYPTISVSASLPGASPDTMAATVATPLERALGRLRGSMRSRPAPAWAVRASRCSSICRARWTARRAMCRLPSMRRARCCLRACRAILRIAR